MCGGRERGTRRRDRGKEVNQQGPTWERGKRRERRRRSKRRHRRRHKRRMRRGRDRGEEGGIFTYITGRTYWEVEDTKEDEKKRGGKRERGEKKKAGGGGEGGGGREMIDNVSWLKEGKREGGREVEGQ